MRRIGCVLARGGVALASLSMVFAPVKVSAGTFTGGATEWTQYANFVTLCMGIVQQINAATSLASQVKSWGVTLKNIDSPQDVMNVLGGIKSIVARTRSLAFQGASLAEQTGLTERWKKAHPGEVDPHQAYSAPSSAGGLFPPSDSVSGAMGQPEEQAFAQIDDAVQQSVLHAMQTLDLHAAEADDEELIFQKLSDKMQTVEGARQVGMMTNELLLNLTRILLKLGEKFDAYARINGEYASADAQRNQYERQIGVRRSRYTGRFRGDPAGLGDMP
jgi:P-type conjugative transfer protein TrbJ